MLIPNFQEIQKTLSKVIAKAWLNESFKQRLMAEPAKLLEENGVAIPDNLEVRVKENSSGINEIKTEYVTLTNSILEILLPPRPLELVGVDRINSWVDSSNDYICNCGGGRGCF
jgi:hypothetical protein